VRISRPLVGYWKTARCAALWGLADADTLRRAFVRHVGVTAADYRKRYAEIPALAKYPH
jgi:AraC-like DNA-binding protein